MDMSDVLETSMMADNYYKTTALQYHSTIVWKLDLISDQRMNIGMSTEITHLDSIPTLRGHIKLQKTSNKYQLTLDLSSESCYQISFLIRCRLFDSKNKSINSCIEAFIIQAKSNLCYNLFNDISYHERITILCETKNEVVDTKPCTFNDLNISGSITNTERQLQRSLANTMELLINDNGPVSPDLVIFTASDPIMVHSSIIAAASPSMESIIKLENNKKTLSLPNNREAVLEMIRFFYKGEIKNIKETALELYDIACAFNLEDIKKICISYWVNNISSKNVVDIISLANKFAIYHLRAAAETFIKNKFQKVFKEKKDSDLKLLMSTLEKVFML